MKRKLNLFIISLFSFSSLYAFTLKEGYELALENSMDFKINKNNLNNIKLDQDIANSLSNPSLDFSAKVERSKLTQDQLTPGSNPSTKSDEYELVLTQPIFDGFESKYEQNLQKERFKSAIYYLKESKDEIASKYISAYINTIREKDLLSLNKERLGISEDIFNKVYKKVNSGYGTKLEYAEAKGDLAESRVNLNIQRINLKESIENLKLYTQSDFDTSELIKPTTLISLPKTLTAAMKIAYKENPTINVAKTNVNVASFEERKTTKDFYPDLNLVGSYKVNNALYSQEDEEYNEYSVGLELKYNLYNGGKDSATNKKAFQNLKDKKLLVKKSEYEIKNKLRLAWNTHKLNAEKMKSLEQYLVVKKDILDSTLKEFDLGLKSLTSLLDTQVEYIEVKSDLISNSYDLLISKYEILEAMGKLSDALENDFPTLEKIDSKEIVKNLDTLNEDVSYVYNDDKRIKNKLIKKTTYQDIPKIGLYEASVKEKKNIKTYTNQVSFKDRFLSANTDNYTINLAYTKSETRARLLIEKYDINNDAFSFSFGYDKPLQKIMYGVFNTKTEALKALDSLPRDLKRKRPRVEKISIKQNLYKKYHGDDFIQKTVLEKKKIPVRNQLIHKVSLTNISIPKKQNLSNFNSFKDKFLNANKNTFTINLAYTKSETRARLLIEKYDINNDAFSFSFGYDKPLQKIMYGVFNTKEEALKALDSLPKDLKRKRPRVEKISIKQNLYFKYNKYTKPSSLSGSI